MDGAVSNYGWYRGMILFIIVPVTRESEPQGRFVF